MNRHLQTCEFSDPSTEHQALPRSRSAPWLQSIWASLCSPLLPRLLLVLAVVAVLGLVLVFHTVVTQAVHQSGVRQQAVAARSQAVWRCGQLPSTTARQACLQELPTVSAH